MKIVDPIDDYAEAGFKAAVAITEKDAKCPDKIIKFGSSHDAIVNEGDVKTICIQLPNPGEWQVILPVTDFEEALKQVL